MALPVTEWVNVNGDVSIIAREFGEVWFHTTSATKEDVDPFAKPMTGAGSAGSTVRLLDGAIHLGFASIEQRLARPEPTLAAYVVALVGCYHTSVHTPRNLCGAASRFKELGRPEVAVYLEDRAREETGHDRLALKDLRALGVPAERLVANFIPKGIKPLCERFDDLSAQDYPIGCIGYAYCLERISALKQKADIDRVQALCPAGVDATRFLRTHSGLEARSRTSKRRSNSSHRSLPMTVSASFGKPTNRHRSWRRGTITNSSNLTRRYSRSSSEPSQSRSRFVAGDILRAMKSMAFSRCISPDPAGGFGRLQGPSACAMRHTYCFVPGGARKGKSRVCDVRH